MNTTEKKQFGCNEAQMCDDAYAESGTSPPHVEEGSTSTVASHNGLVERSAGFDHVSSNVAAVASHESDHTKDVPPDDTNGLRSALHYARMGLRIVPNHTPTTGGGCSCNRSGCEQIGKHPRILDWPRQATNDETVIRAWLDRWPEANIGIVTGAESGIFVLDVDPRHGGDQTLQALEEKFGRLPTTPVSFTGSQGNHALFKHPGWRVPTKASIAPGLDVRGDGGQIVAPPSRNANGAYEWVEGLALGEIPIADAPQWLLDLIRKGATDAHHHTEFARGPAVLDGVPEGQRDESIFHYACGLRDLGLARGEVAVLVQEAASNCEPAFPPNVALEKVANAFNYDHRGTVLVVEDESDDESFTPTSSIVTAPVFPRGVLPPLFKDYLDLMHPRVSEASAALHCANLLALVASEMGRDFVLHSGDLVAANLYILIVAASALGRKTTARALLRRCILQQMPASRALVRNGASTGEGVLTQLQTASNLLLSYDEFTRLLTVASRAGNTIEDILNEAFTGGPLDKIVAKEKESVHVPEGYSLSLIANATPVGLQQKLTSQNMFGGLVSRFLFLASDEARDVPMTVAPDEQLGRHIARTLCEKLEAWRQVGQVPTIFSFDGPAAQRYAEWYCSMRRRLRQLSDARFHSLGDRTTLYAKKLAMIFAVLDGDPFAEPLINIRQTEAGIAVAEFGYESLMWGTTGWAGPRNQYQERQGEIENKVIDALKREQRRATTRRLHRMTSVPYEELNKTLSVLRRAGVVDTEKVRWRNGKDGERWVLLDVAASPDSTAQSPPRETPRSCEKVSAPDTSGDDWTDEAWAERDQRIISMVRRGRA